MPESETMLISITVQCDADGLHSLYPPLDAHNVAVECSAHVFKVGEYECAVDVKATGDDVLGVLSTAARLEISSQQHSESAPAFSQSYPQCFPSHQA